MLCLSLSLPLSLSLLCFCGHAHVMIKLLQASSQIIVLERTGRSHNMSSSANDGLSRAYEGSDGICSQDLLRSSDCACSSPSFQQFAHSTTTPKTSSQQARKEETIRILQNCSIHPTRIHARQVQITQLHMSCHVRVRPKPRHHQRNVDSG